MIDLISLILEHRSYSTTHVSLCKKKQKSKKERKLAQQELLLETCGPGWNQKSFFRLSGGTWKYEYNILKTNVANESLCAVITTVIYRMSSSGSSVSVRKHIF